MCVLLHSAFPSAAKKFVVVTGGASRQESVRRGIEAAQKLIRNPEEAIVAVHDCARCLVSEEIIKRAIDGALKFDAVTVAVPVIDTIKRANQEGLIVETLDRSALWQIQTPQVFRFRLLQQAHVTSINNATDDAALVEQIAPVRLVEGSRRNIKVTTPEDLLIAEALLGESEC